MSFSKEFRLRKRHEFRHLSKVGKRRYGRLLTLQFEPASQKKLGMTVSRKYGKAVTRNRFKRLIREAFRQSDLPSYHLNIFPTKSARSASLNEIKDELVNLTKPRST